MAVGEKRIKDIDETLEKASVVLIDIEGTTTSISFVKDTLFPYIRNNLESYLKAHWDDEEFQEDLVLLKEQSKKDETEKVDGVVLIPEDNGDGTLEAVRKNVLWQMDLDRKTKALKQLQGHIMREGYKSGKLKGHVYSDVAPALKSWAHNGRHLYIYSSGSVEAQKLLFGHSEEGNLLELFSGHFDTEVGPKVESTSYLNIIKKLDCKSEDMLFLTDVPKEAKAAKEAGVKAVLVVRDGNEPLTEEDEINFPVIKSFHDFVFEISKRKKMSADSDSSSLAESGATGLVNGSVNDGKTETLEKPESSKTGNVESSSDDVEMMEVSSNDVQENGNAESNATESQTADDMKMCVDENDESQEPRVDSKAEVKVPHTETDKTDIKSDSNMKTEKDETVLKCKSSNVEDSKPQSDVANVDQTETVLKSKSPEVEDSKSQTDMINIDKTEAVLKSKSPEVEEAKAQTDATKDQTETVLKSKSSEIEDSKPSTEVTDKDQTETVLKSESSEIEDSKKSADVTDKDKIETVVKSKSSETEDAKPQTDVTDVDQTETALECKSSDVVESSKPGIDQNDTVLKSSEVETEVTDTKKAEEKPINKEAEKEASCDVSDKLETKLIDQETLTVTQTKSEELADPKTEVEAETKSVTLDKHSDTAQVDELVETNAQIANKESLISKSVSDSSETNKVSVDVSKISKTDELHVESEPKLACAKMKSEVPELNSEIAETKSEAIENKSEIVDSEVKGKESKREIPEMEHTTTDEKSENSFPKLESSEATSSDAKPENIEISETKVGTEDVMQESRVEVEEKMKPAVEQKLADKNEDSAGDVAMSTEVDSNILDREDKMTGESDAKIESEEKMETEICPVEASPANVGKSSDEKMDIDSCEVETKGSSINVEEKMETDTNDEKSAQVMETETNEVRKINMESKESVNSKVEVSSSVETSVDSEVTKSKESVNSKMEVSSSVENSLELKVPVNSKVEIDSSKESEVVGSSIKNSLESEVSSAGMPETENSKLVSEVSKSDSSNTKEITVETSRVQESKTEESKSDDEISQEKTEEKVSNSVDNSKSLDIGAVNDEKKTNEGIKSEGEPEGTEKELNDTKENGIASTAQNVKGETNPIDVCESEQNGEVKEDVQVKKVTKDSPENTEKTEDEGAASVETTVSS